MDYKLPTSCAQLQVKAKERKRERESERKKDCKGDIDWGLVSFILLLA